MSELRLHYLAERYRWLPDEVLLIYLHEQIEALRNIVDDLAQSIDARLTIVRNTGYDGPVSLLEEMTDANANKPHPEHWFLLRRR